MEPLDGMSLLHWRSESSHHIPISGLIGVVDGHIPGSDMIQLLNTRLLSLANFHRFRSVVTEEGFFKEIESFNAKEVVEVFSITTKHRGCELVDEDSSSGSSIFGLSSDSETSTDSDCGYGALTPFLTEHIERHHNVPLSNRHKLPLWRMHVLQFETMQKTALYFKCHHVICDGQSLSQIFLSLADNFESIRHRSAKLLLRSPSYQRYRERWNRPIVYILFLIMNCILYLLDFCAMIACHSEKETLLHPETECHQKSFAVLFGIGLKGIDKARERMSGPELGRVTVNDFMLSVISEAITRFIANDGPFSNSVSGRAVKMGAVISMNARDPLSTTAEMELNNCVGISQIYLPLSISCAMPFASKLQAIKAQMDMVKRRQFALMSCQLIRWTGYCPPFLIKFLLKLQKASLIVANVNGPRDTLYLDGHRIVGASGVVQNSPGISVSICVAGYDGQCSVSVLADQSISGSNTSQSLLKHIEDVLRQNECMIFR